MGEAVERRRDGKKGMKERCSGLEYKKSTVESGRHRHIMVR